MLVIDFETKDPYIGEGFGAGWVFRLNHSQTRFKILGMGWTKVDGGKVVSGYETDKAVMLELLEGDKHLVVFNGFYDLGCALVVAKDLGVELDLYEYLVEDVMHIAKLYRQDLMSYSLAALTKRFDVQVKKQKELLEDYVWNSGLYAKIKKEQTGRNTHTRPSNTLLAKFAIENMDLIPPEVVGKYCIADCEATLSLYQYLNDKVERDVDLFSCLCKQAVDMRRTPVYIDLEKTRQVSEGLEKRCALMREEVCEYVGRDINFNSPDDLGSVVTSLGLDTGLRTDTGKMSVPNEWLESCEDTTLQKIAAVRKYEANNAKYLKKFLEFQEVFDEPLGVLYVSMHVLGAHRTGRYTSGPYSKSEAAVSKSKEVSVHQIPSRDPELGPIFRSLFIAPEGYKWLNRDFSGQEQRIQVDIACKLQCGGAQQIADKWNQDPLMDFHQMCADFGGIERSQAKGINFGLSFGMGEAKLCMSLGYPVKNMVLHGRTVVVADKEGKSFLAKYYKMLPFMKETSNIVNDVFKKQGYIKTLGGRKLTIDEKFASMDARKGFSKYVQGSAADQTMVAMANCYRSKLKVSFQVHDEINMLAPEEKAEEIMSKLKEIMESAIELVVPCVSDGGIGKNWYESK